MNFADFQHDALYGVQGFYTLGGRAGRMGDFLSSPEVGPLFGKVLGCYLDSVWQSLGSPKKFDVVEVGAGQGTLARTILCSKAQCLEAVIYTAVEVSASQRANHPVGISSRESMPYESVNGVILANELLDNLPTRILVFDSGWRELCITQVGGVLVEETSPVEFIPAFLPDDAPHGFRIPIQDAGRAWVRDALATIERGKLLVFDYGILQTLELLVAPRNWLRTYSGHNKGVNYLANIGMQDITCDVMFDQVFAGIDVTFRTQADFLLEWGIDSLVTEGREYWESHASRPDVTAMAMRSRVSEAEALLDPTGLGGFTVAEVDVS